mmetsp:Transcript_32309/g.31728  ORF Transcript_32309/g.31728 Transcript_32309/m.31728 type:complete len:125 (+) Transcript_32309:512-886(+)
MMFSSKLYSKKVRREENKNNHRYQATKMKLPYINQTNRGSDRSKIAWTSSKSREPPKRSYPKVHFPSSNTHKSDSKFVLLKKKQADPKIVSLRREQFQEILEKYKNSASSKLKVLNMSRSNEEL